MIEDSRKFVKSIDQKDYAKAYDLFKSIIKAKIQTQRNVRRVHK